MGLRAALRGAAQAAIAALGDIPVSANYLSYASATYNASAGTQTTTYSTVAGVKVVFQKFRITQQDGQRVQPGDRRALIAAADMSGVVPAVNDRIVASGTTWELMPATKAPGGVRLAGDPADALHDLHVRQP